MSRRKKNPDYNAEKMMQELIKAVVERYECAGENAEAVSIREIAEEFDMTPLKIRKLLITAGAFSSERSDEVQRLYAAGRTIPEIQTLMELSRASVHSYLPYKKMIYNARELSVAAKRNRKYRLRKEAVEKLNEAITDEPSPAVAEELLWSAVIAFQDYTFQTKKGYKFRYAVKGNEIFVSRKEKSITRSTVNLAFETALQKQSCVSGPKQLNTFGASYLYPIFMRFKVIHEKDTR